MSRLIISAAKLKSFMNRKILLVSPKVSIFTKPCIENLIKMGYEVDFFDSWNSPIWNAKIFSSIIGKISKLSKPLIEKAQNKINRDLLDKVEKSKPDFVLVLKGKTINLNSIKKIRELGIKTINWFPDATTNWNSIEFLAPIYDYFFTYDPYILARLKKKGLNNCYYLPFSADLEKDSGFPSVKNFQYDISFIGSYEPGLYDARVDYLSELADLDLHIWGNKNWLKTPLKKFYHGWIKDDKEMAEIYRKSKIVINIDQQIPEEVGLNLRPFEVTAAGTFLLNDPIKKDIFRLFEDGEEVVVFKNKEDLREKVNYYLIHDQEREKIAQAGFKRTKKEHTYLDRFEQMFNIVSQ